MSQQIMPQDQRAERAVLSSVFLDNQVLPEVMRYISSADFFNAKNRIIFQAMEQLNSENKPIESIGFPGYLDTHNALKAAGGYKYISDLFTLMPTAANTKYYAMIVKHKSMARRIIQAGNKITQIGHSAKNTTQMLEDAEDDILSLSKEQHDTSTLKPSHSLVVEAFKHANMLSKNDNSITGLPTGYPDIDKVTTGLHDGEFTVIAARPAMGKTTLAVNIAENVAMKTNKTVAVFSLEMGAESLINRMVCADGNISANHLRTGKLTPVEWQNFIISLGHIANANIFIDDTPGINVSLIMSRAQRLAQEQGNLGLIVVDYLQLVEGTNKESRQQEVSSVSRTLKKLAKELNIPVIALSQLSRSVEQREDKRPILSDIRESGSIEQDADIVAFLYRKDYYARDKDKDKNKNNVEENSASDTEFIIEKNRSGPRATIHLMFLKAYNKFTSIIHTHQNNPLQATPNNGKRNQLNNSKSKQKGLPNTSNKQSKNKTSKDSNDKKDNKSKAGNFLQKDNKKKKDNGNNGEIF